MTTTYFPIKLPSQCLLYKDVVPDNVRVRAFTGGDESKLSQIAEKNASSITADVLGACLQGVDVKELTLGDKLFLMVWHAINSYSDGFSTKIVCETCLQKVSIEYKLADAKIVFLKETCKEPISVPLSDKSIAKCRLLRVKDEIQLDALEQEGTDIYLHSIARTIIDENKDIVQKIDWLRELPSKDVAKIRAVQNSLYHGPDFTMSYECPKCKGNGSFVAPFRLEHFFPYGNALVENFGIKV